MDKSTSCDCFVVLCCVVLCLFVCLFVCFVLFVCLFCFVLFCFVCLFCLFVCLFVFLFVCLFVCLFVLFCFVLFCFVCFVLFCFGLFWFVCLFVCLFVCCWLLLWVVSLTSIDFRWTLITFQKGAALSKRGHVIVDSQLEAKMQKPWVVPPSSASGKWRFRLGYIGIPDPKNVMSSWWWLASWEGGQPNKNH